MNITQSTGQYTIKKILSLISDWNVCPADVYSLPRRSTTRVLYYPLCSGLPMPWTGYDDCMKTAFRGHCPVLRTRHFLRWWLWCYLFLSARGAMLRCVRVIAVKCPLTYYVLLSCCMRCVQKMIISLWGLPFNPLANLCAPWVSLLHFSLHASELPHCVFNTLPKWQGGLKCLGTKP